MGKGGFGEQQGAEGCDVLALHGVSLWLRGEGQADVAQFAFAGSTGFSFVLDGQGEGNGNAFGAAFFPRGLNFQGVAAVFEFSKARVVCLDFNGVFAGFARRASDSVGQWFQTAPAFAPPVTQFFQVFQTLLRVVRFAFDEVPQAEVFDEFSFAVFYPHRNVGAVVFAAFDIGNGDIKAEIERAGWNSEEQGSAEEVFFHGDSYVLGMAIVVWIGIVRNIDIF